jgi:tRNA1(Val) A37 N6-methylase TrmN6
MTRAAAQAEQLRPEVSEDSLLGGRVRLLQPAEGYRVAIDPLLLAATLEAGPDERVLDLGCGTGAAALCVMARLPDTRLVGLELDGDRLDLARANARLNGLTERFEALEGDLRSPPAALLAQPFDHVLCNPPYLEAGTDARSKQGACTSATREGEARLGHWVAGALSLVRAKGSVTFIHRADRLAELLARLSGPAGEIVVCPLWPKAGRPAKRVIVRARKTVATPLRLAPGLVLHRDDGSFTAEAEAILRDAGPLRL